MIRPAATTAREINGMQPLHACTLAQTTTRNSQGKKPLPPTPAMFQRATRQLFSHARRLTPLVAGSAATSLLTAGAAASFGGPASFVRCDAAEQKEPYLDPIVPPKLDDPEYNAEVMRSWRAKIAEARELFSKLDYAGAERALELALEEAGHFGQSSGPVATSLVNLAQLYRRAGRLADAEPLLERAADVLDQTAGPNNKVTLLALIDLAGTKLERGDAPGALDGYRDVLSRLDVAETTQKHAQQPLQSVRAGCLFAMSKGHVQLKEYEAAEARLREVLALLETRWGTADGRLLAPCAELAKVLCKQGRTHEGASFLQRAGALSDLKPAQQAALTRLRKELQL